MLTPQEVTNSVFEKAVFGGYDTASVDKFMAQLTQDYSALYRENGILKNKMKVLVDKVEEYRSTEDAMRMALLQAERTAKEITDAAEAQRDSIQADVEQKKNELLRQAEAEAEERRAEIRKSLATEEAALLNAKRATAEYLDKLKAAMATYAETVNRVYDFVEPLPPQPEQAPAPEPAEEAPPPRRSPRRRASPRTRWRTSPRSSTGPFPPWRKRKKAPRKRPTWNPPFPSSPKSTTTISCSERTTIRRNNTHDDYKRSCKLMFAGAPFLCR